MDALLVGFIDKDEKPVWINPAYVARLERSTDTLTWVWFGYGDGSLDIQVKGSIVEVAMTLNMARREYPQ